VLTSSLLGLLRGPAFIADARGGVRAANATGRKLVIDCPGGDCLVHTDELAAWLTRVAGTSQALPGRVDVRTGGRIETMAARAVVAEREPELLFAIELINAEDNRFAALTTKIGELKEEVRARQSAQARAEETARANLLLFRELQHRVKNQLQMVLAIFSATRRELNDPDQHEIILKLEAKLQAISSVQRATYYNGDAGTLGADGLLDGLVAALRPLLPEGATLECHADDTPISHDQSYPIALITNELVSNSIKHGRRDNSSRIRVSLCTSGSEVVLTVSDNGGGFQPGPDKSRSSGLGLVRGLCRQIGGRLEIDHSEGACVSVAIPLRSGGRP
jgi:two-component sensor histidine kinase